MAPGSRFARGDSGVSEQKSRRSVAANTWRLLIGRPLRSNEAAKEQITPVEGLSALSLDALTSVAYGPEAIIVVLAVAGRGALHLVLPITLVIIVLLARARLLLPPGDRCLPRRRWGVRGLACELRRPGRASSPARR